LPIPADEAAFSPLRVDGAHAPAAPAPEPAATTGELVMDEPLDEPAPPPLALVRQVRTQVMQLSAHLYKQREQLDHREAELNARLAAMEGEMRAARLWLQERQQELAEREQEAERRAAEFAHRPTPSLDPALAQELRREADEHWQRRSAELAQRCADLDAHELALAREQSHLAADRAHLAQERAQWEQQRAQERDRHERARHESQAALERERAVLRERMAGGEARRQAVEQLHAQALAAQREAIEMRLATEELWVRIAGRSAHAEATTALAQLRQRLADQQRLADEDLAARQAELERLSARLTEQHAAQAQRAQDLRSWYVRRRRELDDQAAALAAEFQELREERLQGDQLEHAWQAERERYQRQIRRLERQLRRPACEPAAA
jgi:hypothetical protein